MYFTKSLFIWGHVGVPKGKGRQSDRLGSISRNMSRSICRWANPAKEGVMRVNLRDGAAALVRENGPS